MEDFDRLPFVTKAELIEDQTRHPPYGEILTFPVREYCRLHQTSGTTTGKPLRWLDTRESWTWLLGCWERNYQLMGLTAQDVFFFPFSFGPFLGFWSAFEAASRAGFLVVPGGGMSSSARLRLMVELQSTVVCCTPTYALHLAELAEKEGVDLAHSAVRAVVVAGEPGGSIPATRERIEKLWGARLFDHYGLTEIGPVAIEEVDTPESLTVLEDQFFCEVVEPNGVEPAGPGEIGELVVTNLGRLGSPLIRYRTGDLVRASRSGGKLRLEGGIVGRTDDMIHVRGNNVYPATIEAVVRKFPEVVEFRLIVHQSEALADLRMEIEPAPGAHGGALAEAVAKAIRDELLFRVEVQAVAEGSLPRFEMKARRILKVN